MARFYVDLPLQINGEYQLPDAVVRHLNVLRTRLHEAVVLFNATGCDYLCRLLELSKRTARVLVIQETPLDNESRLPLCLLVSLIAADKFDLVLQKAVELGVKRIIPLYCQNTQRFNADKLTSRMEHWRKIIIAASEQCHRSELAALELPTEFAAAVPQVAAGVKFILSPRHSKEFSPANLSSGVTLLIGPEGGFTENEISLALANDFHPLQLGPRILRAETAAIAALCHMHSLAGDFTRSGIV